MPRQSNSKRPQRPAPYSLRAAQKMPAAQVQSYLPVPLPTSPWTNSPPDRSLHSLRTTREQHSSQAVRAPDPPSPNVSNAPSVIQPSQSGPWSSEEDERLLYARARGIGWNQIKLEYFPQKTSNACRKRYERLQLKRKANDWDDARIERLALGYRDHREQVWRPLAEHLGERWEHVEKACMDRGLKTLQNLATNHTRVHAHAHRRSASSMNSGVYSLDVDPNVVHDDSGIGMEIAEGSRRSSGAIMPGWSQILQ